MTLLELIEAYGDARARGELGRERAHVLRSQIRDALALGILRPVLYPAGTPEYAAYAAELKVELAKFAAGEEPCKYPRTKDGQ